MGRKKHFVLIDLENVCPKVEKKLPSWVCVHVVVGAKQDMVPVWCAERVAEGRDRGELVRVERDGPNALDFVLCGHLGGLVEKHPGARFTIVSKDKGYDPLVAYLTKKRVRVERLEAMPYDANAPVVASAAPVAKKVAKKVAPKVVSSEAVAKVDKAELLPPAAVVAEDGAPEEVLKVVWTRLKNMKSSKPASVGTLKNTVRSMLVNYKLGGTAEAVFGVLCERGRIRVSGSKVEYL